MVVNTVSNNNVSVENDTFAELSVVISSRLHEDTKTITAVIRKKKRLFFMRQRCFIQRLETIVIASYSAKRIHPFGISPFGIHPQRGSVRIADTSQRDWSWKDLSTSWISLHSGYVPMGLVLEVETKLVISKTHILKYQKRQRKQLFSIRNYAIFWHSHFSNSLNSECIFEQKKYATTNYRRSKTFTRKCTFVRKMAQREKALPNC